MSALLYIWLLSHRSSQGLPCADPEGVGDRGSGPPAEKSQNIGYSSNTGPDPLKIHKATKPAFNVFLSNHRHVSVTPFKWCFAGGPMMALLFPSSTKKKTVKVGPPLTKLSGSAHVYTDVLASV